MPAEAIAHRKKPMDGGAALSNRGRIYVIKADGRRFPFDEGKVRRTCVRAGASKDMANRIVEKVSRQIYQDIPTRKIYKIVLDALSSEATGYVVRHRYRLKEAIRRMGPAGTQFEEFVAKILESQGYQINSLRSKIKGKCISHEVDISAYLKVTDKRYIIECKYHNLLGIFTGIKESLYTHARFLDLRSNFDAEILVTNTKVSSDVIAYASCIGQDILSWRFPPERGLERLIEEHGLYPITILPLSRKEISVLYKLGITLAKDLLQRDTERLSLESGMSSSRIRGMQDLTKNIIS